MTCLLTHVSIYDNSCQAKLPRVIKYLPDDYVLSMIRLVFYYNVSINFAYHHLIIIDSLIETLWECRIFKYYDNKTMNIFIKSTFLFASFTYLQIPKHPPAISTPIRGCFHIEIEKIPSKFQYFCPSKSVLDVKHKQKTKKGNENK